MSHFVGVGLFLIDLKQTDLGCWQWPLFKFLCESEAPGTKSHKLA